ncbi:EEF1A lysine methyltransferase 4 isoform X2 [Bombina bombina]|uniref:EEF1A lysine methyltransferase 4 isoform X2 n=1 Tax=Bombina bombina TaxID=8345 RepID=UPI00235A6B9E|nr:EEF1A lysine methyltransferase 4 isoform X2 [Bombina bombina]
MYKEQVYWDSRYQEEQEDTGGHEWFGSYSDFSCLVRKELRPGSSGLVLGCGTSSLSVDLHAEGVSPVVSIDYSPVCIAEMAQRHAGRAGMSWLVMDARELQFPDGSFDLVIEKGTLDAMMVDEKDPWSVSPQTITLVSRVLSPDGIFISVTFSQPHFRGRHYAQPQYGWSVSCNTYGVDFHYFLYTMRKGEELSPRDRESGRSLHEPHVQPELLPTLSDSDNEDFLTNICV